MITSEVQKTGNENALSTIRKFSRRVQGTNLIRVVRAARYHSRSTSKLVKKKRALKLLKRQADFRQLVKEGKVVENPKRRGSAMRETDQRPAAPRTAPVTGSGLGESTPIAR